MAARPEPRVESPRPKLSWEEFQQQLDEAFGTQRTLPAPPPQPTEPPPKLSPEEIQRQLNEAFAPWEWAMSHPTPGPVPAAFDPCSESARAHADGAIAHLAFALGGKPIGIDDLKFDRKTYEKPLPQHPLYDGTNPDVAAFAARGGN